MKPRPISMLPLVLSVLLCGFTCISYADGLNNKEVQFTGTISSLVTNGDGTGTVFIQIAGFELRVVVNAKTEVVAKLGEDLTMSALKSGDIVEVTGKYSSSGILASEIRVTGKSSTDFDIRGHITAVQPSGSDVKISLLGITVLVTSTTTIQVNGAVAAAADLKVGTYVQVEGTTGTTWTALLIKILKDEKPKGHVRFEGVVSEISKVVNGEQTIMVKVEGLTDSPTPVTIDPNTRVTGEIALGVSVMVFGVLDSELNVTATKIHVLEALEIKPDERKLKVGETAVFTVKLRESAAADTVVKLSFSSSDPPNVLSLSSSTVTVLKGSKTADFSVKALLTGLAVITAEALGQKATAEVKVGEVSEDENERPAGDVRIMFAPGRIKMDPNSTRDVVLLIQPPQKADVAVKFAVSKNLVVVDSQLKLGNGVSELKMTIKSGSAEGTDWVSATLPDIKGSPKAELLVEVSGKNQGGNGNNKTQIDFSPDEVTLDIGQTVNVKLSISVISNSDITVVLGVTGNGKNVEVPTTITIPKGKPFVEVPIKGIAAGKVHVTAALAQTHGGDTARLVVNVNGK